MIDFDTRWIGAHGIGRFCSELQRRIPELVPANLSGNPAAALDSLRLSYYVRTHRPKLFLSPGFNAPIASVVPYGLCVHDLNHIFVPGNSSVQKRLYYEFVLKRAVRHAAVVFTVSEFSRASICNWAGVGGGEVVNVGNGVSQVFFRAVAPVVREPYLLCVGADRPHKNWCQMFRAFAKSCVDTQIRLVLTSRPSERTLAMISDLRIVDRISVEERPSDERLAQLYAGSIALLFVSTYEGFGLPIVEAMAAGAPVISSNVASMPEVCGSAAMLVDPSDHVAIAGAIRSVCENQPMRLDLISRGRTRAMEFTWEKTAQRVRHAINERNLPGIGKLVEP